MQLDKVFPVLGSIVLLGSWAVQQFLYNEWNASLTRIGSSEAVFHSYRANDGVFRALRRIAPQVNDEISNQQFKNFEKGLYVLKTTIDSTIYADVRARAVESIVDGLKFDELSADGKILVEFDVIQTSLSKERSVLSSRKSVAEKTFLALYVVGTLLIIAGGLAKLRAKPNASGS